MKVFDVESTKELTQITSDFLTISSIVITTDLKYILALQANIFNNTLRIYDYNTYELVTAIPDVSFFLIDAASNKIALFTSSSNALILYEIVKKY